MKQLCLPRKELICFAGRKKTIFSLDLIKVQPKKSAKIPFQSVSKRTLYLQKETAFSFSFYLQIKTQLLRFFRNDLNDLGNNETTI